MPITFDRDTGAFRLANGDISLILSLHAMEDGSQALLMRHLGPMVSEACEACQPLADFAVASFDTANAMLPFACPTGGHGDFRPTQVTAIGADGNGCTRLTYLRHEITPGKPRLSGLPATYTEADAEASTLLVTLGDEATGLRVTLRYTLFEGLGAIAISTRIENGGSDPLVLTELGSASLSLPGSYDLLHLHGAWARERSVERIAPMHGERALRSKRGASGHQHNPFAALLSPETTETTGPAYGVSLVYSGNFHITVDEDAYGQTRVVTGIDSQTVRWTLAPGEAFEAPEAVIAYSENGLNGMSQIYHRLYRTRLCRGRWRDAERPILINNWEATYFSFTEARLLTIAQTAADLGVELFVLDDGWFGTRDSDTCALGDWFEHESKLPQGISGLSEKIHAMGLLFGLWFEPEMISEDSDLYRAHPDWCLHAPGRYRTPARQQLILDMSRKDVQDYLIETISAVLTRGKIDYVKWDMNRNFAEIGSQLLTPAQQAELPHRYMLGVYRVMEALTSRHPDVLLEGCSGGGGRFDPGMLYYSPQIWTSDDSDAVERLRIQYGTSIAYPPSAMGAHVSAVPNHQVGRMTSLGMRGHVAMGGVLGYELDLSLLSDAEQQEVAAQIAFAKETRRIVQQGVFTRLESPFAGNRCAWQFVDGDEVLAFAFQVLQQPAAVPTRLRLRGLTEGVYEDQATGKRYAAEDLMHYGLLMDFRKGGDFQSRMVHLKRV